MTWRCSRRDFESKNLRGCVGWKVPEWGVKKTEEVGYYECSRIHAEGLKVLLLMDEMMGFLPYRCCSVHHTERLRNACQ